MADPQIPAYSDPSDSYGYNTFVPVDVDRVVVLICDYTGKEVVG